MGTWTLLVDESVQVPTRRTAHFHDHPIAASSKAESLIVTVVSIRQILRQNGVLATEREHVHPASPIC